VPHFKTGVPAAAAARELTTNALKRFDALDEIKTLNGGATPFTVVVNQMGQNDTNVTLSAWRARSQISIRESRHDGPASGSCNGARADEPRAVP
jgi:hypothetical protein